MPVETGWVSQRERVPTAAQVAWIDTLRDRDILMGGAAENTWGADPTIKKQFFVRVALRLQFEFRKMFKPLYSRVNRALIRTSFRVWSRRRTVRAPFLVSREGVNLEWVDVLNPSVDLDALLATTSASHWVLTRGDRATLRSGVSQFLAAASSSDDSTVLWCGDSRTPVGDFVRRPPHSLLLVRQADVLGTVVMVSVEFLRRWGKLSSMPRELIFLALGLDLPASATALIEHPVGIGTLVWQPSEENADTACEVVRENLALRNTSATVSKRPNGTRAVEYSLSEQPKISIVIPTRGSGPEGTSYIEVAVDSIVSRSSYENFEIVIVADDSTPASVVQAIDSRDDSRITLVRWSQPFDFSKKMNLGAAVAQGDYVLFLNDDVEVVSHDWMQRMLSLIGLDNIAYTGALLYFDDASVQHAGHLYAGGAGHVGIGAFINERDPNQILELDREVSGVTAACSLMRTSLFAEVGGFSEVFPGNYNDVDLSLKVLTSGHNIAVAGGAKLYHFESKTRDATVLRTEVMALHRRWAGKLRRDEYWRASNY